MDDVVLLSLYSGLGGAELSLQALHHFVSHEVEEFHAKGQHLDLSLPKEPTFLAACDIDHACQKTLQQHEHPPAFIIGDIMNFVKPEVVALMQAKINTSKVELEKQKQTEAAAALAKKLAAKKKPKKKCKSKPQPKPEPEQPEPDFGDEDVDMDLVEALDNDNVQQKGQRGRQPNRPKSKQMDPGELLLKDLLKILDDPGAFRQFIPVLDGRVLALEELTHIARTQKLVMFAGSTCKDWSSMNQFRQELLGSHLLAFACTLGLVRLLMPMTFLHECTRLFKPSILRNALSLPKFGDHHYSMAHQLLDPRDFAFPVRRSRCYTAMIRDDYEQTLRMADMSKLFSPVRLNCGIFFQASDFEVRWVESLVTKWFAQFIIQTQSQP